jgi:hypothetical protein
MHVNQPGDIDLNQLVRSRSTAQIRLHSALVTNGDAATVKK